MPDKPSRSVFVPVLIVTAVAALGLVVTLVPIVECRRCPTHDMLMLANQLVRGEVQDPPLLGTKRTRGQSRKPRVIPEITPCPGCNGRGTVPILNVWSKE